ncbi:MAG: outer membrane beta-barrel protein, partial [Bacteroidota bacterium]
KVTKNIQSTFVEFPLWVRFKGKRIQNMRPYVLAGGKYALDLASNAKKKADNTAAYVFINRKDIYALGGVGFDFYTAYFKFGTEITMSYGLFDILKRDNTIYTETVSRMSSKIFQISFTFE